jgi:RHS repeat-associated protein
MPSSPLNQSVSLVTGKLALPLELVSAPGQNGLDIEVSIFCSSNVQEQARKWNDDAPTGVLGLGWSLPLSQIIRDTRGTGADADDTFYLVENAANRLIQTGVGSDVRGGYRSYEAENYLFWQIRYYPEAEEWMIKKEDGSTYIYGDTTATINNEPADAVQWGIKWGNWLGSSVQMSGQMRYAVAWNLSAVSNLYGQILRFKYEQVLQKVGSGGQGLNYTKAAYLSLISADPGYSVAFNYEEKDAGEYPASRAISNGATNAFQQRYESRYLSSLVVSNENHAPLYSVRFGYGFLNQDDSRMKKRVLTSISKVGNGERAYEPGHRFSYYGMSASDGVSVSASNSGQQYSAGTGALYGALKSVTWPSGEVTAFKYGQLTLPGTERSLKNIKRPQNDSSSWSHPRVYFGADYIVVTWNGSNKVYVEVYQWRGKWVSQDFGSFATDVGKVRVLTTQKYFAIITPGQTYSALFFNRDRFRAGNWTKQSVAVNIAPDFQAAPGEQMFAVLETKNGKLNRFAYDGASWVLTRTSLDSNSTALFGMAATGNYVCTLNARSDNSIKPTVNLFYLDALGAWGQKTLALPDHFFAAEGNSQSWGVTTSETGINGITLAVGESFIGGQVTAQTVTSSGQSVNGTWRYRHFVVRWTDTYSSLLVDNMRKADIYKPISVSSGIETSVLMNVAGNLFSLNVVSESKKYVSRFDGRQWNEHVFKQERQDDFYGFDSTLEVSTSWGAKDTKFQQHDPNTGSWAAQFDFKGADIVFFQEIVSYIIFVGEMIITAPLGLWEGLAISSFIELWFYLVQVVQTLAAGGSERGINGLRYLTVNNALYFQKLDGTWSSLGSLLTGNQLSQYPVMTLGENFTAYMTAEVTATPYGSQDLWLAHLRTWAPVMRNGRIVNKLTLETASEQSGNESALTIEPSADQLSLVGPGTIVAYPRQGYGGAFPYWWRNNFKNATSFNLYRVADEQVAGALTDFVVSQIDADDGYQTVHTFFDYDVTNAVYALSESAVRYNKVTVAAGGRSLAESKKFGSSEYYYYNGSTAALPYAPAKDDDTNADDYPEFMAGKLYHRRAVGESAAASTETRYWKVYAKATRGKNMGYFARATKIVDTLDDVTTITESVYDVPADPADTQFRCGLLRSVKTYNYNSDGVVQAVLTEYLYGWEKYEQLKQRYILSRIIQTRTTRQDPANPNAAPLSAEALVSTWKQWTQYMWAPAATYRWLGTGASDFNAWGGGDPGADWLKTSELISVRQGIVLEVEDGNGVAASIIYDKNYLSPVARFDNASVSRSEAVYLGFESYENYTNWEESGVTGTASIIAARYTGDSYTGAACLKVAAGKTYVNGSAAGATLSPWAQRGLFVLSAFVKTGPGFGSDAGAASFGVMVTNTQQQQTVTVSPDVNDTGGQWQYLEQVIDLGGAPFDYWAAGDAFAFGIIITNRKKSAYFLIDNICLSPLASTASINVYDETYRTVTADLGSGGKTNRYAFDALQREIGMAGHSREVFNLVSAYFSRDGNGDAFRPADPNYGLAISARSGGRYFDFRGGDAGGWKGGTVSASRELLVGAGQHATLANSRGNCGIRAQVATIVSLTEAITVGGTQGQPGGESALTSAVAIAIGTVEVRWDETGTYTLSDSASGVSSKASAPLATDWLLFAVDKSVYFFGDGRLLFALALANKVTGDYRLSVEQQGYGGKVIAQASFTDILTFFDPVVSADYRDGSGQARQTQFVEGGASVIIAESLYDSQGRAAMQTAYVRKGSHAAHAGLLGFEADFVKGRDPLSGDPLWSSDPADPHGGAMNGLIQQWLAPQFSTQYPYSAQYYEKNPVARVSQLTEPEQNFIANASHAVKFRYDKTAAAQSLLTQLGIPSVKSNKYYAETRTTAISDTQPLTSINISDLEGRLLGEGSMSNDASLVFSHSYAFHPSGAETVTTCFPNRFAAPNDANAQAFKAVDQFDPLRQLVSEQHPDAQTTRYAYDRVGRLRFSQDADNAQENRVLYWKYDRLGRVAEAGYIGMAWVEATLHAWAFDDPDEPASGVWLRRYAYDMNDAGQVGNLRGRMSKALLRGSVKASASVPPDVTQLYEYDIYGNVVRQTSGASGYDTYGYTTAYTYDNLDNVTSVAYPGAGQPLARVAPMIFYVDTAGEVIFYSEGSSGNHPYVPPVVRSLAIDTARRQLYFASTQAIFRMDYISGDKKQLLAEAAGPLAVASGQGKLYWVSNNSNIASANLDGTARRSFNAGTGTINALAVDPQGQWVYWMIAGAGIFRSKPDGSQQTNLVPNEGGYSLSLDAINGKIYWTFKNQAIKRANLDGSAVETVVGSSSGAFPLSCVVTPETGQLYWADQDKQVVKSSDLNGQNIQTVTATQPYKPFLLALDPAGGESAVEGSTAAPPALVVTYGYDMLGQLTAVGRADDPACYASYLYNADGSIMRETLNGATGSSPNVVARDYTYNSLSWLTQITNSAFFTEKLTYTDSHGHYLDGSIATQEFTFRSAANFGSTRPTDYKYTFNYDSFSRLLSAQNSAAQNCNLAVGDPAGGQPTGGYDANGNILKMSLGGVTRTYRYAPGTNRLSAVSGGQAALGFSYSPGGRVTSAPGLGKIQYDSLTGLPARVDTDERGTVEFYYGSEGDRVLKKVGGGSAGTVKRLYLRGMSRNALVEKISVNDRETGRVFYIYGPTGLVAASDGAKDYFFSKDHLGSTAVVFDKNKAVAAFYNYLPFGDLMPGNNSAGTGDFQPTRRYTGQEWDEELGLYNYRARFYDCRLGRYYAPDPARQYASPYVYVGNNPLDFVDPDGEVANPFGAVVERTASRALVVEAGGTLARGLVRESSEALARGLMRDTEAYATRFLDEEETVWSEELLDSCPFSFVRGTRVATGMGLKAIESLAVGDLVWGYDAATGDAALYEVTKLYRRVSPSLTVLTVEDERVETTAEHPFWVEGRGWVEAQNLSAGDRLKALRGETRVVESVSRIERETEVFNFEVAGVHNYYVTAAHLLVHNPKSKGCGKKTRGYAKKLQNQAARSQVGEQVNIVGNFNANLSIAAQRTKRLRRPPPGVASSGYSDRHYLNGALAARYRFVNYKAGPLPNTKYVDFTPYIRRTTGGRPLSVRIQYQGTRARDFAMADARFNLTAARRAQLGTWHHVPDVDQQGFGTLELIPTDLHNGVAHYGGVEKYKTLAMNNGLGWPNFY